MAFEALQILCYRNTVGSREVKRSRTSTRTGCCIPDGQGQASKEGFCLFLQVVCQQLVEKGVVDIIANTLMVRRPQGVTLAADPSHCPRLTRC